MMARTAPACVLVSVAVLAGCHSTTAGSPVGSPPSGTEPSFPTSQPTRPTAAPPRTINPPPPSSPTRAPGSEELTPANGYVYIETKSGKTRCQLDESEVGCESQFTNSPTMDGMPANGVRLTADGTLSWIVGNLGDIPVVTLDYRTYQAVGWTIVAGEDGTRFTNDATRHGMVVATSGVQSF
ncbi:hypothetical protein ACVWWN_008148 [Mycobacterium sp. URHB0021]